MSLTQSARYLLLILVLVQAGCGSGGSVESDEDLVCCNEPPPTGLLIAADNEAQFLEIFSQSIIEDGEDYLNNDGNADVVFAT